MVVYYSIAFFHLPNPIAEVRASGIKSEVTLYVALLNLVIILLGLTGKAGMLFSVGARLSGPKKILPSILTVSFYLALIGVASVAIAALSWRLTALLSSSYWNESHWFWVALLVFVSFSALALIVRAFGLYQWEVLRNLKAIPLFTPAFCFGGPFFLKKNLAEAGVDDRTLLIYGGIIFLAGGVFLVYLVLFALFDHRYRAEDARSEERTRPGIVGTDGRPLRVWPVYRSRNAPTDEKPVYIGFLLMGIGMSLTSFVIIDASLALAHGLLGA